MCIEKYGVQALAAGHVEKESSKGVILDSYYVVVLL